MSKLLFLVLALLGSTTAELTFSPAYPSTCLYLPKTRFVGGNLIRRPILNLRSPSECGDACLAFPGPEKCLAFTFYPRRGRTECWLKYGTVTTKPDPYGDSGFPDFYYNATYPDLSSNLRMLIAGTWDASKVEFGLSLRRQANGWELNTRTNEPRFPPSAPFPVRFPRAGLRGLPKECSSKGMGMNLGFVANNVLSLPILNLKCPEDCRKACFEYQEESGRYSCIAFNFNYVLPVNECWLKAGPIARVFRLGMVSGRSGREGFEIGQVPKEAAELVKIYRDLIAKSRTCIALTPI